MYKLTAKAHSNLKGWACLRENYFIRLESVVAVRVAQTASGHYDMVIDCGNGEKVVSFQTFQSLNEVLDQFNLVMADM